MKPQPNKGNVVGCRYCLVWASSDIHNINCIMGTVIKHIAHSSHYISTNVTVCRIQMLQATIHLFICLHWQIIHVKMSRMLVAVWLWWISLIANDSSCRKFPYYVLWDVIAQYNIKHYKLVWLTVTES